MIPRPLPSLLLAWLAFGAASLPAQTVYLREDFDGPVFPPPGWVQDSLSAGSFHWELSSDFRAWHDHQYGGVFTADDTLWTTVDLSAATVAYVHFDLELNFPTYLYNNPTQYGDGRTEIVVRPSGTTTWTVIWDECRTDNRRDFLTAQIPDAMLGGSVDVGIRYYAFSGHEEWLDRFQVDDQPMPPNRAPQPSVPWTTINLPTTPWSGTSYFQDFESGVTSEMAFTSLDSATMTPDPDGWCTIANTMGTHSGNACLEMGVRPGGPTHYAFNAFVLYLDLTQFSDPTLEVWLSNWGEEDNDIDGIWISENGVDWHQLFFDYEMFPAVWADLRIHLAEAPVAWDQVPVYLMFGEEDNYAFGTLDGVSFDDVAIYETPPPPPCDLRLGLAINQFTTPVVFVLDGVVPGGAAVMLYGHQGSFTHYGAACSGLTVDLSQPQLAVLWRPANPVNCLAFDPLPNQAHGFYVQGVDLTTCCTSNVVYVP